MRDGATFAQILDAQLGCADVPSLARPWSNRPLTTALFAFELPLSARPAPPARPAPIEPPRPTHLTPLERQTLDEARTLNALRRAYRTLARRYHPDHHHGCTPAERERLSRLFAEATARYRLLAARVH